MMTRWHKLRNITPEKLELARIVLDEIRGGTDTYRALRRHPLPGGGYLGKDALVAAYRRLVESGEWQADDALLARIRMKPIRSLSGVTTVTVLTKPHPCPGNCIFCPTDERMPKSYLVDEPGAARAFQNQFDPFAQCRSRLDSYLAVGHPVDKIELLILGGSWTAYPRSYQEEFILRCFDALNGVESATLAEAQRRNETAACRNVGLVVETRPNTITVEQLAWFRDLGVTKVQMGAQSMDDRILALNRRGHTAAETLQATALLRAAGFKIVLHWMPNLLGATPASDRQDFARLWQDYCPDEIKIYPTQLMKSAGLYQYWERGEYQPYPMDELIQLIADVKPGIPPYCRVNRVIRDIPSHHVVAGNRRTSLRQDVLKELARRGQVCHCIRCREIRGQAVSISDLTLDDHVYHAADAGEHFLQYVTSENKLAGYLRLSLPEPAGAARVADGLTDLQGAALIREVHIYGQSLGVGKGQAGAAQHSGLGTRLIKKAVEISRGHGYQRLAVIAAVGTRRYYQSRGFRRGERYMIMDL